MLTQHEMPLHVTNAIFDHQEPFSFEKEIKQLLINEKVWRIRSHHFKNRIKSKK